MLKSDVGDQGKFWIYSTNSQNTIEYNAGEQIEIREAQSKLYLTKNYGSYFSNKVVMF